jgi:Leucine-rich repeat (LRR) protein
MNYKMFDVLDYCFDTQNNPRRGPWGIEYIQEEVNSSASFLKEHEKTYSKYALKKFQNYGFDPLNVNNFESFKNRCSIKLGFLKEEDKDQACQSLFNLFQTAVTCFNKPLPLISCESSKPISRKPVSKKNESLDGDVMDKRLLEILKDVPGLFNYCFKLQNGKHQELTDHDYIDRVTDRLILHLKDLSENHSEIYALAMSRFLLKKFQKYGFDPSQVTDFKSFKNKCKISSERFLNKINKNRSCRSLYNLFQSAIEGAGGIKYHEICSNNQLLLTSSATVGMDYLPPVKEEVFQEDFMAILSKTDLKVLNKISRLSELYKLIAKKEIKNLPNEIDLSEYEIHSFTDLVRLLNFVGKDKCQKIEKLTIPIDLLTLSNKDIALAIAINFPNVQHLSFVKNKNDEEIIEINDKENFEFIKRWPLLESIDLSGQNHITTVEWLKWAPGLKVLNLKECNKLKFLFNLRELKKLTDLNLEGCFLFKLNWIESLVDLENLNLRRCYQKEGYHSLSKLTKLKKLNLSDSNFSDIFCILPLDQLEELDLSGTKAANLEELKSLLNLKKLSLAGLKIDELNFLRQLLNLENLNLSNCVSGDIILPHMPNLQILDLSDSEITKIEVEKPLDQLIELNAGWCKFNDLIFLNFMVNLEKLNLSGNKFNRYGSSLSLKKLKYLDLSYTKTPMHLEWKDAGNLRELNLKNCDWVRDVDFLENLPYLYSLNLKGCSIDPSAINYLKQFPKIKLLKHWDGYKNCV